MLCTSTDTKITANNYVFVSWYSIAISQILFIIAFSTIHITNAYTFRNEYYAFMLCCTFLSSITFREQAVRTQLHMHGIYKQHTYAHTLDSLTSVYFRNCTSAEGSLLYCIIFTRLSDVLENPGKISIHASFSILLTEHRTLTSHVRQTPQPSVCSSPPLSPPPPAMISCVQTSLRSNPFSFIALCIHRQDVRLHSRSHDMQKVAEVCIIDRQWCSELSGGLVQSVDVTDRFFPRTLNISCDSARRDW